MQCDLDENLHSDSGVCSNQHDGGRGGSDCARTTCDVWRFGGISISHGGAGGRGTSSLKLRVGCGGGYAV